jgi:hypothetical protein
MTLDSEGNWVTFDEWIKNLNIEFRELGIDPRRRPWEAIGRYAMEFNTPVDITSDVAGTILKWFESHSKPGVHQVGSQYEAVYFYDSQFWIVSIPVMFGTVSLNALDCLHDMPEAIKQEMVASYMQAWDYVICWADCLDYGAGIYDFRETQCQDTFGAQLLMAADQELRVATSVLSKHHPDSRAILNCRMALEIFFKAYAALKGRLTEAEAKAMNHNLHKGLDKFVEISERSDWEKIRPILDAFPEVHERYREQDITFQSLWRCYSLTHSVGAAIIREFTGRDTLAQSFRLG